MHVYHRVDRVHDWLRIDAERCAGVDGRWQEWDSNVTTEAEVRTCHIPNVAANTEKPITKSTIFFMILPERWLA